MQIGLSNPIAGVPATLLGMIFPIKMRIDRLFRLRLGWCSQHGTVYMDPPNGQIDGSHTDSRQTSSSRNVTRAPGDERKAHPAQATFSLMAPSWKYEVTLRGSQDYKTSPNITTPHNTSNPIGGYARALGAGL